MAVTTRSPASTYHVFLSFRGEDTRHGFTGNLFKALSDKGIRTFIDDEKLQRGEEITPALMKAIEKSKIAITVLSEDYASSSFCLEELATILERKGMLVIPVFYKVDPSDVRHLKGTYEKALAKLEEKFKAKKENMDKLQKWKKALGQVANLSGFHFKHGVGYEYKFIEKIVEQVSRVIKHVPLIVAAYPVGLEPQVLQVRELLDVKSDDGVRMIGIHGMGGVGKSALAGAVYNDLAIAANFNGKCFLENVREKANKHGLEHLQSFLLSQILQGNDINFSSWRQGASMIRDRLQGMKVLLVLDDVDKRQQLEKIVGGRDWFGSGSIIIITTRDKQLLESHQVNRTYEVKKLNKNDALQLLTWKAFKKEKADPRYEKVLNCAVKYASGLPLALEVIGSNLYGKSIKEWKSAIECYKRIPNDEILKILKVSFDALGEEEKNVFLDLACCLKGRELIQVEHILRALYDELQVETSQVHCPAGELPYSCQVEDGWSKKISYSNVASVKKLNKEDLSKQSGTRNNAPSLVARLMGIDTMPLPLDTKSAVPLDESKHENMERKFSEKGMNGRGSVGRGSSNLNSFSRMEFDSFYQDIDDDDDDRWGQNFGKPRPREHPQEEDLQKFKKKFEAYQAASFKEWPKVVDIGSGSRRMLSQENLSKEKMQHIASSKADSYSFKTKLPNGDMMESVSTKKKESFPSRSKTLSRDFEESLMMKSRSRLDICASPTQIVILKPGSDTICNCNHEENCISLSSTLHGRKGIEDFLEEVRERLKCELQGIRASGIETPYNEKLSDAKEVRESVTRDAEPNLFRSESARSYKSKMQFNGPSSPEFFNIDTRRFLSERLRNIVKSELHLDIPEVACYLDNDRVRLKQDTIKCATDKCQWGILKEKKELHTGSYRYKLDDNVLFHKELSPRNLERSLSAPASGTSFGRLLLEDRHILTGALIQRKLEAVEAKPVDVKKQKKNGFNIKEKLSNFKYTLGLRGKLFGKRVQSIVESHGSEYGPILRDIRNGPTVLMKYGERHENSTEVPPSPASVCSCAHEEHWRQTGYSSLTSTPDVSSLDDIFVPKAFRDISSGLNELKRQLSQLDSDGSEDFTTKKEAIESELVQLDDPAESYVRDLLVASGLYFGSWDKSLLRGDTFAKPIGNSVFEEVEESHKKLVKENERSTKDQNKNKLEHKVLLDLLNEALSIVLGPPLTLSRFRRKLSNSSMQPPPCGKELLKLVWDIVSVSLYPTPNTCLYSLDSLVTQELGSISWSGLTNDQIDTLEREMACVITDDLVEEFTKDMLF